jgi:hypothetical protein
MFLCPNHSLIFFFFRIFNRWTSRHCLHVSASPPAPVTTDTPATLAQSTSDSYLESRPPPTPSSSFTTAYAMLLYNVCYLAYTQGIEIPLSQAGDVLSNLWSVCCSAELGRSVDSLFSVSTGSFIVIDAVVLIKHTHYFRRPRRRTSHSILHNYSRLQLPPPRRDRARRAHAPWGKSKLGARYPKRTSGTCWTMTKQVLPNSHNPTI